MYDVESMNLAKLGLDREGMVLVALMSGGDYLPEGVPGCGVKVACEAARGGFGKTLCRLKASAKEDIQAWRDSLIHELLTNEKGAFRCRHKALTIPEDFPNLEILRYYTHPVVSPESKLDEIREKFHRRRDIHFEGLREFTRETFDWDYRIGAIKFIRVLGEALLIRTITYEGEEAAGDYIKRISSRRTHFSTDASAELRLAYVPEEVVPIDLSKEVEEEVSYGRSGLALNSDDDFEDADNIESTNSASTVGKVFDPTKPALTWVLESVARHSIPKMVEHWEMLEAAKAARKAPTKKTKKATGSKAKNSRGMPNGALHQYVRVSKAVTQEPEKADNADIPAQVPPPRSRTRSPRRLRIPPPLEPSKHPIPATSGSPVETPWTLASSQPTPRTPKRTGGGVQQAILISSSPVGPPESPPSPSPRRRQPPPSSMESTRSVYQIFSQTSSQRVNNTGNMHMTKAKITTKVSSSQETRLKQTSLDLFTTKVNGEPTSSKSITLSQSSVTTTAMTTNSRDLPSSQHIDFDSDDDLVPLSSLTSTTPTSPSKRRQKSPLPTRSSSPRTNPARKKKLLVPRTSAVGYFKEVEVDEEDRDEAMEREASNLQRNSGRAGVSRWSDVAFVDLTGDD